MFKKLNRPGKEIFKNKEYTVKVKEVEIIEEDQQTIVEVKFNVETPKGIVLVIFKFINDIKNFTTSKILKEAYCDRAFKNEYTLKEHTKIPSSIFSKISATAIAIARDRFERLKQQREVKEIIEKEQGKFDF